MIWERRQADLSRIRTDDKSLFDVKMNLEIARSNASSFAVMAGATLAIVENRQGDIQYASDRIISYLKTFI